MDVNGPQVAPPVLKNIGESCGAATVFDPTQFFLVYGFPSVHTRSNAEEKSLSLSPFGFITGLCQGDRSRISRSDYQEELHLLFEYSEGNQKDEHGEPIPRPEPKGISGCGVLALPHLKVSVDQWEPGDLRLVATRTSITRLRKTSIFVLSPPQPIRPNASL
jgi:hypothetical protein